MWERFREALRQWLLHGYEPVVKVPPVAAPVVMTMESAGNENVQRAPATAGPVRMSMKDVGSGNMQVGCAEGDVTIQVNHQTPLSPVTNMTSTHVHHHYYGAAAPEVQADSQTSAANSARTTAPVIELAASAKPETTQEQKQLLSLMKPLDKDTRIKVLNFMRTQFQTAMVVELQPHQVYRVRKYVEKVQSNAGQRQRA